MKTLITLLLTLICVTAEAKILVIADIDDTLKVTNVRSKAGAGSSAFDDHSRFVGMSDIFQAIKKVHPDTEFHYVSLAPSLLMSHRHKEFLTENNFPITAIHMNPGIFQDPQLKQKVIRSLLKNIKPDLVINFGDNGQFDTQVYRQMDKEFPQIESITYIREAYSHKTDSTVLPVLDGQIGFVTALEVSIDLIQKYVLPIAVYGQIETIVAKGLQHDDGDEHFGKMVFPWWQDCRDFVWRWQVQNPTETYLKIRDAIDRRCSI